MRVRRRSARDACPPGRARSRATMQVQSRMPRARSRPPDPHALPQHEHGVEDRADRIETNAAVQHRDPAPDPRPRPRNRALSVLDLGLAEALAFDDCMMGRPDLRLGGRAPPPGCQDGAHLGDIFGLHERASRTPDAPASVRGCERQLGIGGDLDVAHALAAVRDRYAANLGVILRPKRRSRASSRSLHHGEPNSARSSAKVPGSCPARCRSADRSRTTPRRSRCRAGKIAAGIVARRVFAPTRYVKRAPAAVAGACIREHHGVAAVGEQMRLRRGCVRREQTSHLRDCTTRAAVVTSSRADAPGETSRGVRSCNKSSVARMLGSEWQPLAASVHRRGRCESHDGHAGVMGHECAHVATREPSGSGCACSRAPHRTRSVRARRTRRAARDCAPPVGGSTIAASAVAYGAITVFSLKRASARRPGTPSSNTGR